jgi:hypothetical protein
MPRIPRGQQAGFVYHVINRGNGRATIFHKAQDYFGLRLFQTVQTFNRCAHQLRVTFQSFQSFNRFAPFKPFQKNRQQKPPNRTDHRKALRCTVPGNQGRLAPWLDELGASSTMEIERFVSRMNAWDTSTNIRKWWDRIVESGKFYKSLTLSLPVTKTLQFMYTTATMCVARLGQSI